ncbi:LysR family transcriptional regulator [Amphritea sp. HPY]|uniref:LysR family transcriptional regulator n=1 Tax=Amphritea sp. HPY TaxID=3421652 RepID=UPI003D7C3A2F
MKPLRQFDLNLLIILEALLSECHVSRAADKVFLSQSAMSHALNRLRQQLDDPLLVRTGNGLQPTPRAAAMLPEIRRALQLVERTLSPPESFIPENSKRCFKIACTDYFEAIVLPALVSHLQHTAPAISIEVEMITEASTRQQLESREIDLIVGIDRNLPVPDHLVQQHWITETQICVAGTANNKVGDSINLQQYTKLTHVVFSDLAGETSNAIDQWLANQQLQRKHSARTVNYMAAARIVASTDGIITLPLHMAKLFSEMLPVRLVSPPAGVPEVAMTTIHHPLFSNDPGLLWLLDQVNHFGAATAQAPALNQAGLAL